MKKDIKLDAGWDELPVGAIIEQPGTAEVYETGTWRTFKPIFHADRCIQCFFCYIYCPDEAVTVSEENKVTGFDYEHCKGCGICAEVCPDKANAIEMVLERTAE